MIARGITDAWAKEIDDGICAAVSFNAKELVEVSFRSCYFLETHLGNYSTELESRVPVVSRPCSAPIPYSAPIPDEKKIQP
jgi:hypothetical protein